MRYRTKSLRNRRGTNKWEACLVHADPMTGKDACTYHTIEAKTRKQAERARDELVLKLEMQGFAVSSNVTIQQFLNEFLEYKQASKTIEPSTVRGYKCNIKMICRYIGSEKLSDLSIPMVNSWMARMSEDYAPRSVCKCFRLLKQAVNYAIAQDMLMKNPCNFCKPPKRQKVAINALSREERSRMLDIARKAQPAPLAVAIEIALTTGMRRGEVCGLRWSDFDEEKRTISVNRAIGFGDGGFYVKQPKTDSVRTIPLTNHTWHLLKGMKEDAIWMLSRLKVPMADSYILGTLEKGSRPYSPTILTKDFSAFCKMNGFKCNYHDLRHTFATYLIGSGTDVRTVSSYLGHSSVAMTLDVYADVDPEAKKAAVSKIEEAFDDSVSVFQRESESRLRELEAEQKLEERRFNVGSNTSKPERMLNLPAESIPFTAEELEAMLAILKAN